MTPEMAVLYKYMGGFMFIVGCMLSSVRWNPSNGILSGFACMLGGVSIAHTTYGYAAVLVLAGLHVKFNPNPAIKAAEEMKKK